MRQHARLGTTRDIVTTVASLGLLLVTIIAFGGAEATTAYAQLAETTITQ